MFAGIPILLLFPHAASGVASGSRPPFNPHRIHPFALISNLTVLPATVSFVATDPDLGSAAGTAATATWSATAGAPTNTWTLAVQAGAGAFTACGTVPTSAVTVTCTAASASGVGGTGTCAAPFPLSTAAQQVASGKEGTLVSNFSVSISFSLADSWRYVAALAPPCTLSLTYTANTP
jgi:hypothetical protein